MIPDRPLDRFPVLRTRSIEEMRDALERICAKPVLVPEDRARKLNVAFNHYQLRHVGVSFIKYGSAVRVDFPHTGYAVQMFPVRGNGEILNDRALVPLTKANSVVNSAGISYTARLAADYEQLVLRIQSAALTNLLSAVTGTSIDGALRFDPAPEFARPESQILRQNFMFLVGELSSAAAPLPSLLLAEYEQTLMVMFLHANRHNDSHLLEHSPPDAAPSQVRRAEEYIAANWDRPISLEALAAITGVSARSLSRSFKRSRGYSPMQFAEHVRLKKKTEH